MGIAHYRCHRDVEDGWQIVPEVAPIPGEPIIDKPGKGSVYAPDLELLLRARGITHLVLTGITTDVCVHTTMREANDRGYECLILSDCTGATDPGNHVAALQMVTMQGGVFGAVATSAELLDAIRPAGTGDHPGSYSNHNAASGGSTMTADAGRPCHGSSVASTAP